MASITLQTSLSGPADNAGTCRVLYEVTQADGLAPEIFVVHVDAPAYKGGPQQQTWRHVAYADEMSELPTSLAVGKEGLFRKAVVTIEYTSLEKAEVAISSIRAQIQRLVNELNILAKYTQINTWVISSRD